MNLELTSEQRHWRDSFRAFTNEEVAPHASKWDRQERLPRQLITQLARQGYLGASISKEFGGHDLSMVLHGLLHEELGRGCSSTRSLLTVHGMVAHAIQRWGTPRQREQWLPRMASGDAIGAFCLTEANVGSDAKSVETSAVESGDSIVIDGSKRWTTFGEIADVYLVFASHEAKPSAFLVERETRGLSVAPMRGNLGMRASMIAEVTFDHCRIPSENLLGRAHCGISHVGGSALQLGRYTVAWGCIGIGQACLEASLRYSTDRSQFDKPLREHQLIKQMLSNMITELEAARLLAYQAGCLADCRHPKQVLSTLLAKYFASRMANRAAFDAVQIHGGNGCSNEYPVERLFRDARVMEIIEGSTQIQQLVIAGYAHPGYEGHGGLC